ncbi:Uncharacterized protein dnl_33750 [Desulfonema limicola]|uniref:Uncharacterized protein n=1 Tax=Desulfonema limicola TaxID=45656 RepID=A0A975B9B3_9BACT|nr:hypothetical protein [Desulfonema limicola]QTA81051.1 Uncharacterized protein dnl_33750 [Desulfonema limicola]
MRIFLAVFICITFTGGLGLYMSCRTEAYIPETNNKHQTGTSGYSLLITAAFAVEPDPFAIQTDDTKPGAGLIVSMGKKEILRQTRQIKPGIPVLVKPLKGLVPGINELYIEASPFLEDTDKSHALRVQIMEHDFLIAEKTFWSFPGGKIADTIRFKIKAQQDKEDNNDH